MPGGWMSASVPAVRPLWCRDTRASHPLKNEPFRQETSSYVEDSVIMFSDSADDLCRPPDASR